MTKELLYVADPMCSWCWGFASVLDSVRASLAPDVTLRYVMSGLAPDSDEAMPDQIREMVMGAWGAVAQTTGASFNESFWTDCAPRRSTYPACRAVLAAERLEAGSTPRMFAAIQRAYYQEARNPSDMDVLSAAAASIGLDTDEFEGAATSEIVAQDLNRDLALKDELGVAGFPSLVLRIGASPTVITRGWAAWKDLEAPLRAGGALRD